MYLSHSQYELQILKGHLHIAKAIASIIRQFFFIILIIFMDVFSV
jgi:hypothetical protein